MPSWSWTTFNRNNHDGLLLRPSHFCGQHNGRRGDHFGVAGSMIFSFSQRSIDALKGVHPDLVKVAHAALAKTPTDFGIIEGLRTGPRQHELFLEGKSKLDWPEPAGEPRGRHLTGHAFDFAAYVDGEISWEIAHYIEIAAVMKWCANELGIAIHCGMDNPTWKDNDHVELLRSAYPDEPLVA